MNKRSVFALSLVTAVVLVAAGALMASNMGFKLNRQLKKAGAGSLDGTSSLSLPYNQQLGLINAANLGVDIGGFTTVGGGRVVNVQRLEKSNNTMVPYTGGARGNFNLVPGEAYRVRVNQDTNYITVGSHKPDLAVAFVKAGPTSLDGSNEYSYPYHSTATNAANLGVELGGFTTASGPVINIARLEPSNNTMVPYTGGARGNFNLVAGEGYRVRVNSDLSFTPSHY